jgi:transcription elongation factor GreA
MERMPITKAGYAKMEAELKDLKSVQRPYIIGQIAEARAHGDLKENAEYKAAKDRQSYIEGRIQDLEARLSLCEVIDPSAHQNSQHVKFGAHIEIEDIEAGHKRKYQIVCEYEANLDLGLIAYTSPVAKASIGKTIGDVIEVHTPKGLIEYEIIAVKYA